MLVGLFCVCFRFWFGLVWFSPRTTLVFCLKHLLNTCIRIAMQLKCLQFLLMVPSLKNKLGKIALPNKAVMTNAGTRCVQDVDASRLYYHRKDHVLQEDLKICCCNSLFTATFLEATAAVRCTQHSVYADVNN